MVSSWAFFSLWAMASPFVTPVIWIAVFFLPAIVVIFTLHRELRVYRSEADLPFTDFLLRPPGESTRLAAEAHFEKFTERLMLLLATCAVLGMAVANLPSPRQPAVAAWLLIPLLAVTVFTAPRMPRLLRKYWNCQLGFRGERLVGEQLNQLLAHGFHVFHDLPFDGYNIDHVVVGPAGVVVIETKTRRKWKSRATVYPAHKVRYDGSTLTWPTGRSDRFGLDQAARNARSLSEWLSRATGETVVCRPILTLPGWWIDRATKTTPEVAVISAKALSRYLAASKLISLSPAQVTRIAYQLSERCRVPAEPSVPPR
jgi:hypothetical protein